MQSVAPLFNVGLQRIPCKCNCIPCKGVTVGYIELKLLFEFSWGLVCIVKSLALP